MGAPRLTIFTFLCRHVAGDPYAGDDSIEAGWFDSDTAAGLVTHPVEQVRLKDSLGDDQGVIYRAYRGIPSDDVRREEYEMLRLHRC